MTSIPFMSAVSGACSRAKYQMAGADRPRCGSLASRGLPEVVRLPSTTQLFEPLPSAMPSAAVQSRMPSLAWASQRGEVSGALDWGAVPGRRAYTPASRYNRARSALAAGCSPG